MVDVPVLIRAVAPGETVTAQDVGRALLASDRLTQSFVTDPAELVGKTPRRTIRPSEPIRPVDVQTPVLVRRNELVTIVLQTPGVMLTAQGKAAEEGGKGATIRVANTKSGRVLDAVVTGPATVAVLTRPGVN
jgi:flagella basal body P-ring formation protein FlgA